MSVVKTRIEFDSRSDQIVVNHLRLAIEKLIFFRDEAALFFDETSLLVDEAFLLFDERFLSGDEIDAGGMSAVGFGGRFCSMMVVAIGAAVSIAVAVAVGVAIAIVVGAR